MAYAFNEDKTKVEVYSKGDFKIVDVVEYIMTNTSKAGMTELGEDIDDINDYVVISLQLYSERMNRWFIHDSNWFGDIQLYNNDDNKGEMYYEIHNHTRYDSWVHLYIVLLKCNPGIIPHPVV